MSRASTGVGASAAPIGVADINAGPADLLVSLRGVNKTYDSGVTALGPLDLDVRRG